MVSLTGQLNIEDQLFELQVEFKKSLPAKMDNFETLWDSILAGKEDDSRLVDCHRQIHTLVGTAGTFGAISVTSAAREIEQAIKFLTNISDISQEIKTLVASLIVNLKKEVSNWEPSRQPYLQPMEENSERKGNLIYLADDDELLAKEVALHLSRANFEVEHFLTVKDFDEAISRQMPAAIIMDITFKEKDTDGINAISRFKEQFNVCPPIIFISIHDDIDTRLAAAKAGAQRYLTKPLDLDKLSKTLDALVDRSIDKPYRILLVDDDISLLKYYETVLNGAGMEVRTISKPMDCLIAIEDFKPDVLVLDVHMPQYSGPEIAQIIRQDDHWALMPIMFLSTETDIDIQLDAMNLGAESFLMKPISAGHLVSAMTAKAKTSRWNSKINNDLEKALRESEYNLITSNKHNILSTTDIAGRITSVNKTFCEISGYSEKELIGQNHRLLKSDHHSDAFFEDMWKTISSGKIWQGRICNYNKKGKEYWVESTIVPFLDAKGKPYKYVSARTDVTASIQSEERLERSQQFANIGTWDWDIESGSLFWSDQIWPLFGYDKTITETSYENFIEAVHPDDKKLVTDAISLCVEKNENYNIEHRVVWPDGSIHWLQESGDVIRDRHKNPLHMLGVVQDITERKKAEKALIASREEAESANRAKSQFLSSMSHELRTPMNAIMGFGQLLHMDIEQPLTVNQQENVNEIMKASEHLLALINQVLDLSKIESGRIELSIEDVLLGNVITESLQLILPLANRNDITIKLYRNDNEITIDELSKDSTVIRADYTRTKQVIINLLSNAVKYNSMKGNIEIRCNKIDNHTMRVSIKDTGKGLDEQQQSQLFTAFNRLGVENSEIEGTGIGLVITKNIVELMGGTIGVESELDVGSTFWFELPLGSEFVSIAPVELSKGVNIESASTVLYIEDNPANLRLVTQLMSRLPNVHLLSAPEPMLGLELAEEHNPDLILLDINLPGMNGYEVLEVLRERATTSKTPVLAISANAMPSDIKKGMEAGFNNYITKPIDVNALLVAVDNALNK